MTDDLTMRECRHCSETQPDTEYTIDPDMLVCNDCCRVIEQLPIERYVKDE